MKKRFMFAVVSAMAVLAVTATAVLAAEEIPVTLTEEGEAHGHPELRSGHLIANPDIARLVINGALPDKGYLIVCMAHEITDDGPDQCKGEPHWPAFFNAVRKTDAQGNLNILFVDGWSEDVPEVVDVRIEMVDLDPDPNPAVYSSECAGVAVR